MREKATERRLISGKGDLGNVSLFGGSDRVKSSQGLSFVMRLSRIMMPRFSIQVFSRNCARSPASPLSTCESGSGSTKVFLLIDLSKRSRVRLETTLDCFCENVASCLNGKFGTFRIGQKTGLIVVEHVEAVKIEQIQAVIPCSDLKQLKKLKLYLS